MLIRRRSLAQARMPSMRALALNPRAPGVPVRGAVARAQAPPQPPVTPSAGEAETPEEWAARTGGFHESSYELQHGLHISESDWPEDVTIPGVPGAP